MSEQQQKASDQTSPHQTQLNKSQESKLPQTQQKRVVHTNIPPPYELFEKSDEGKRKQIYNTMVEQIKQYLKANEEQAKVIQQSQNAEELNRLKKENEHLKKEIDNNSPMKEIIKKMDEDTKCNKNILYNLLLENPSQQQDTKGLLEQFQKEMEVQKHRNQQEKEVLEKKNAELQKILQQQHQTMSTLQNQVRETILNILRQLTINPNQAKQEKHQTPPNKNNEFLEKIQQLENQIHSMQVKENEQSRQIQNLYDQIKQLQNQREEVLTLERHLMRDQSQIMYLEQQNEKLQLKPNELKILVHEWQEINDQKRSLDSELQITRAELYRCKDQIVQTEQQKNQYHAQYLESYTLIQQKNDEIQQTQAQLELLKGKLQGATQVANKQMNQIKEYQTSMEDIIGENSRLLLQTLNQKLK